jgi:hypothetical protein
MIIAGDDYGYAVKLAASCTTESHEPYTVIRLLESVTYESYGVAAAGTYVVIKSDEVVAYQARHKSEPVYTRLC